MGKDKGLVHHLCRAEDIPLPLQLGDKIQDGDVREEILVNVVLERVGVVVDLPLAAGEDVFLRGGVWSDAVVVVAVELAAAP